MMKRTGTRLFLQKEFIIYLFPAILIVLFYLLFNFLTALVGMKDGYLLGMICYWLFGCLVPCIVWMTRTHRRLLLRVTRINWWQFSLVVLPVLVAVLFGPFQERLSEAATVAIILSLPYAFVNAFCEEFFWRGLYFAHHSGNYFHAVVVPTIWFAVWHYVPLSILPAPFGNFYFILAAMLLGLCWATVTYYTRSVFWSIVSHTLVDFSGIGVLYYFN